MEMGPLGSVASQGGSCARPQHPVPWVLLIQRLSMFHAPCGAKWDPEGYWRRLSGSWTHRTRKPGVEGGEWGNGGGGDAMAGDSLIQAGYVLVPRLLLLSLTRERRPLSLMRCPRHLCTRWGAGVGEKTCLSFLIQFKHSYLRVVGRQAQRGQRSPNMFVSGPVSKLSCVQPGAWALWG